MRNNFLPTLQYTYAGIVVGGGSMIYGAVKGAKAKKEQKELMENRAKYNISPFANDETALAESEFANGMSAEANQAYTEGMDSSLAASLGAMLKSGGSANNIAEAFADDAVGRQRFAMFKDQMRSQKMAQLVQAYRNQTDQYDKQFMYNVDAPQKDAMQAAFADRQSASNLMTSGINMIGSGAVSYFGNKAADKRMAKYFDFEREKSGTTGSGGATMLPQPTDVSVPSSVSNMQNLMWGNFDYPSAATVSEPNFIDFNDYKIPHLE